MNAIYARLNYAPDTLHFLYRERTSESGFDYCTFVRRDLRRGGVTVSMSEIPLWYCDIFGRRKYLIARGIVLTGEVIFTMSPELGKLFGLLFIYY